MLIVRNCVTYNHLFYNSNWIISLTVGWKILPHFFFFLCTRLHKRTIVHSQRVGIGSIGNKSVNRGVRIGERNFILGTLHMCILGIYILYKVLLFYSFSAFIYLFFCGTIAKYSVGELFIIFHIHKFSKNMTRRKLIKLFDFWCA